jgi:DNA polymerase-3 subunit alpha
VGSNFVHLHTHSEYSILDSTCKISALVRTAADHGMPALALTDHGSMGGAIRFYREARRRGIQPILGCEVYLAPGDRHERSVSGGPRYHHLVLLAMNDEGYRNLLALVTRAHIEGFYYRPRVDWELLADDHRGLIALSACQSGEIPRLLLAGRTAEARRATERYAELFDDRFYLEIQDHGTERDHRLRTALRRLAGDLRLPLVATNDIHYLAADDAQAHEVLLNVRANKKLIDEDRRRFDGTGYHFRSAEEMATLFADDPEALENTARIAARCALELRLGDSLLPPFELPPDVGDADAYLRRLSYDGARERFGEVPDAVAERLDYELGVIAHMQYSTYFLIVWDFVRFAREEGIPVGPGRGSAAGSMVAYCLGITSVDPLRYNITFERFLNPDRISMPDVDIDFCIRGRDRVIEYVRSKYGGSGWETHTAQIATYDRLAARSVVRDVGRVMGTPYGTTDRLAKLIPFGVNLRTALERVPEIAEMHRNDAEVRRIIDTGLRLEGLVRNCSTHAAGVVISPEAMVRHAPLMRLTDGEIVTQFDMVDLEAVGLLKFDFLGLRNLTIISDTCRAVNHGTSCPTSMESIPLDDEATYRMISEGKTAGVFQLEGAGMTTLIRRVRPNRFEDLIALLALYRPGPLDSGMTEEYVRRRTGEAEVRYPHESLRSILEETYGLPIYQDQQMLVAQRLGGFTLAEADTLRKAMGKKDKAIMGSLRDRFLEGCTATGLSTTAATQLFEDMEKFSRYGFTKSHTTAYAFISYWTAYLKANHPTEFMASLLSSVHGDTDKVSSYIGECRAMGIEVRPPDINESDFDFTCVGEKVIRFGLAAVKHVSHAAIHGILAARNGTRFTSLFDLCRRAATAGVDRESLEALIKAGAFDSLGHPRLGALLSLSFAMDIMQRARHQQESGQCSFFDGAEIEIPDPTIPDQEFPADELLGFERELLGLYVSSHPLDSVRTLIEAHCTPLAEVMDLPAGRRAVLGGMIRTVRQLTTKKGDPMAFVTIEDGLVQVEFTVFPEVLAEAKPLLLPDLIAAVVVSVERRNGTPNLVAQRVLELGEIEACRVNAIRLRLTPEQLQPEMLRELRAIILTYPGPTPLTLSLQTAGHSVDIEAGRSFRVSGTGGMFRDVRALLGEDAVDIQWGEP